MVLTRRDMTTTSHEETNVSLRQEQDDYDTTFSLSMSIWKWACYKGNQEQRKVSLLQRQSRTKKSEPVTKAVKNKTTSLRHLTSLSLPTNPRDSNKDSYGTSPMVQRVHDTWMESWKVICSTTVSWHKECMNIWMESRMVERICNGLRGNRFGMW